MSSTLDHALAYSARGWSVIPLHWITATGACSCARGADCSSPGKHPLTANGVHSASRDESIIREWFAASPSANVGIATGRASGVTVLDVDTKHDGFASLNRFFATYGRPDPTPVVVTGSGGRHIYWQYTGLGNRVGLLPGLDIRDDGGYVVAPPSLHVSGNYYEWHRLGDPATVAVQPAPRWLREAVAACKRQPSTTRRYSPDRPKPRKPARAYDTAPKGQRNEALFRAVSRAIWEGRRVDEVYSFAAEFNAAQCHPPLSTREVEYTVRHAIKRYG